jgi:hypothetical protein
LDNPGLLIEVMGKRACLRLDQRGDGGFMEALLAMMVVTVAVALLALAFTFTAHDLKDAGESTGLEKCGQILLRDLQEDHSIWRDSRLAWTSLDVRVAAPYDIPDGAHGYAIEVHLIDTDVEAKCIEVPGSAVNLDGSRIVIKHACSLVMADGNIAPGLIIMEVW